MKEITLEALLEAGCHFGHQVTRHNPKSRDFVFEARDNIHIIDLAKTKEGLDNAIAFVKNLSQNGGTLLVVGTKRQAQGIVQEEVKRARELGLDGIYFVTNRWIGGTFTNFAEVAKNYKKLRDVTVMLKGDDGRAKYTKKELGLFEKGRQKMEGFYGGVKDITKIPDAVFIVDTHMEALVVHEATQMNVKTVGMVDTNADPFVIDYPIPANDDAAGSVKIITAAIVDAWIEGRQTKKSTDDSLPAGQAGLQTTVDDKKSAESAAADGSQKAVVAKEKKEPKAKKAAAIKTEKKEKVVKEKKAKKEKVA